jgi:hypothetical protein
MKWDELIIGILALIWGGIVFAMRAEILELSREGGKGLRNRKVLNAVVIAAIIFLITGGLAIILIRGL